MKLVLGLARPSLGSVSVDGRNPAATAATGDIKWTLSVIACGLLLFLDALLLPAGGWLQLALKAVMVVGAIGCLLATQWVVKTTPED